MQASSLPGLRPGEGVGVRVSHRPVEARSPVWRLRLLVSIRSPSVGPQAPPLLRSHPPCRRLRRSPRSPPPRRSPRWSGQARSPRQSPEPLRVHRQSPHQQQGQLRPQAQRSLVRPRRLRPSLWRPSSWWSFFLELGLDSLRRLRRRGLGGFWLSLRGGWLLAGGRWESDWSGGLFRLRLATAADDPSPHTRAYPRLSPPSPSFSALRRVVVWVRLSRSMRSLVDMRFLYGLVG